MMYVVDASLTLSFLY